MDRPRTHEELQELLGAYALDAVDPDEADAVELHLRECPRCRDEVAGHREAAAQLGHVGAPAPAGLWQRIAAELEGEAPPALGVVPPALGVVPPAAPGAGPGVGTGPPVVGPGPALPGPGLPGPGPALLPGPGPGLPARDEGAPGSGGGSHIGPGRVRPARPRRQLRRTARGPQAAPGAPSPASPTGAAAPGRGWVPGALVSVGALVAAAAVVVALAVQVGRLERRLDDLVPAVRDTSVEAAALAALADPEARRVPLRSADGASAAEAVLLPSGEAFLVASALPQLPPDQTYQLWAVLGERKISVGVLGRVPRVVAFRYAGDPALIALTVEPAGGVETTTKAPVVYGAVPPRST